MWIQLVIPQFYVNTNHPCLKPNDGFADLFFGKYTPDTSPGLHHITLILKNASIYVNEDLTKLRATLICKGRKLVNDRKLRVCWTWDGRILVQTRNWTDEDKFHLPEWVILEVIYNWGFVNFSSHLNIIILMFHVLYHLPCFEFPCTYTLFFLLSDYLDVEYIISGFLYVWSMFCLWEMYSQSFTYLKMWHLSKCVSYILFTICLKKWLNLCWE